MYQSSRELGVKEHFNKNKFRGLLTSAGKSEWKKNDIKEKQKKDVKVSAGSLI